jgi:hypothetical protein
MSYILENVSLNHSVTTEVVKTFKVDFFATSVIAFLSWYCVVMSWLTEVFGGTTFSSPKKDSDNFSNTIPDETTAAKYH